MVTYDEYLKNILTKILDSHNNLLELKDKPGDLEIIHKELLKINSFFQAIINKLGTEHYQSSDLVEFKSKIKDYLENYYFEREIEIMKPLYADDPNRIKNIRIKIIEALNDRKLMEKLIDVMEGIDD